MSAPGPGDSSGQRRPAGRPPRHAIGRAHATLRLLARGLSNQEIAAKLVITPTTVGNHVEHIYAKIDASTRARASLFAMQYGLLPDEEFAPPRVAASSVDVSGPMLGHGGRPKMG